MTQRITIKVHGQPAPQGSKRHVGGGRMVEQSKRVKPWRAAVEQAARGEIVSRPTWAPFDGPVKVRITFTLPRPAGHFRSGRYSHLLKPTAPVAPIGQRTGDLDKHQRSTYDALTAAGIWTDDSLVVRAVVEKVYGPTPGAYIEITEVLP